MWEALSTCGADGAPFSLLGALDVALYRQNDERFREYAAQAVIKLCDDGFGQQDDIDYYQILWTFARFRIQSYQSHRERLEAAGILETDVCVDAGSISLPRALARAPATIDMDSLEEWSMSKYGACWGICRNSLMLGKSQCCC